jgi:hypothetical protein
MAIIKTLVTIFWLGVNLSVIPKGDMLRVAMLITDTGRRAKHSPVASSSIDFLHSTRCCMSIFVLMMSVDGSVWCV